VFLGVAGILNPITHTGQKREKDRSIQYEIKIDPRTGKTFSKRAAPQSRKGSFSEKNGAGAGDVTAGRVSFPKKGAPKPVTKVKKTKRRDYGAAEWGKFSRVKKGGRRLCLNVGEQLCKVLRTTRSL